MTIEGMKTAILIMTTEGLVVRVINAVGKARQNFHVTAESDRGGRRNELLPFLNCLSLLHEKLIVM